MNCSREWFPLQGLISVVTKMLKFPYQATDHCISSTSPRVMGNTPGWAATPRDNFHTASSSPKILHVTEVSLLWLQHRVCRCSPGAARAGSEAENGASAVTNMTGLDVLLLESAEERHCASWQQCWLTKAHALQTNSHNDLKKALWNMASSSCRFSGSGNASTKLPCCVQQEMPSLWRPGVPRLGSTGHTDGSWKAVLCVRGTPLPQLGI